MAGGVGEAELRLLLRDFDSKKLDEYEQLVIQLAREVERAMPGLKFEITRMRQYRNMAEYLVKQPMVMDLAEMAFSKLGRPCVRGFHSRRYRWRDAERKVSHPQPLRRSAQHPQRARVRFSR